MIDADRRLATSAISQGRATLLHVAAEANQLHFVKELVKLLSDEDLELQDRKGNTAFCLAAASGNVRIVKVMARRNSRLPTIRRGDGLTPLHMAALQGKNKMAWHLYHDTVQTFNDADWDALFFFCLKTDIYDLALKVLREKPRVALARNENQETGLHVLARKPSSFSKSPTLALQLVKCLWETLLSLDGTEMQTIIKVISEPSQVIFIATEVGNFEVLAELVRSCPELMWEVDTKNRSIIHIAALHRHIDIYNLIHETSSIRNFVVTLEDEDKNNLLHYAAKLSPPSKLNLLPGPVLQMKFELMWYEVAGIQISFSNLSISERISHPKVNKFRYNIKLIKFGN
ncbi:hypothetical protein JHK86_024175 [Glycine max]|nr:hypothetical protein JHK86_024175 [Glycine max]